MTERKEFKDIKEHRGLFVSVSIIVNYMDNGVTQFDRIMLKEPTSGQVHRYIRKSHEVGYELENAHIMCDNILDGTTIPYL